MIRNTFKKIENFLVKQKKLLNLMVIFFDRSSKITHFFLFDLRVYFTVLSLAFMIFFLETENLLIFSGYLREIGVNKLTLKYAFINILPFDVKLCLFFIYLLVSLVSINMVLISFSPVRNEMILKYGPDIIKLRGYNSPVSSLVRTGTLASACLLGYCADLYAKDREGVRWGKVCDKTLETSQKIGQPIKLPPAPWESRQIRIDGHVQATIKKEN